MTENGMLAYDKLSLSLSLFYFAHFSLFLWLCNVKYLRWITCVLSDPVKTSKEKVCNSMLTLVLITHTYLVRRVGYVLCLFERILLRSDVALILR